MMCVSNLTKRQQNRRNLLPLFLLMFLMILPASYNKILASDEVSITTKEDNRQSAIETTMLSSARESTYEETSGTSPVETEVFSEAGKQVAPHVSKKQERRINRVAKHLKEKTQQKNRFNPLDRLNKRKADRDQQGNALSGMSTAVILLIALVVLLLALVGGLDIVVTLLVVLLLVVLLLLLL